MTYDELKKQHELQQKLIQKFLMLGDHLERRMKLVQKNQHAAGEFAEYLITFPTLMKEKVYTLQKEGLLFFKHNTPTLQEDDTNGKPYIN